MLRVAIPCVVALAHLCTTQNGDFYADVRDINVELGVQMCGCSVFPKGTAVAVQPDRCGCLVVCELCAVQSMHTIDCRPH